MKCICCMFCCLSKFRDWLCPEEICVEYIAVKKLRCSLHQCPSLPGRQTPSTAAAPSSRPARPPARRTAPQTPSCMGQAKWRRTGRCRCRFCAAFAADEDAKRCDAGSSQYLRRHSARQWRYAAGSRRGSSSSAMASAWRLATCASAGMPIGTTPRGPGGIISLNVDVRHHDVPRCWLNCNTSKPQVPDERRRVGRASG